jgi:hypothetical protein
LRHAPVDASTQTPSDAQSVARSTGTRGFNISGPRGYSINEAQDSMREALIGSVSGIVATRLLPPSI